MYSMQPAVLIIGQLPDPHIQAVIDQLHSFGAHVAVFNRLVKEKNSLNFSASTGSICGWLQLEGKRWDLSDFGSVWWRVKPYTVAEQLGQPPALPEAFAMREWRSALESLPAFTPQAKWINPRSSEQMARHKPTQLRVACEHGFFIPPTLITNDADEAKVFFESFWPPSKKMGTKARNDKGNSGNKIIYKPLTWYAEPPDKLLFTSLVNESDINNGKAALHLAPGIFQQRILKDYELRVTIVGERIFAVRIDSQAVHRAELDWRRAQDELEYTMFDLDDGVSQRLLRLHRRLGLVFGAYDLIVTTEGEMVFLEVNPMGQWLWLEKRLNLDISQAIAQALFDLYGAEDGPPEA
jgi:hypothetical protein